MRAPLIAVLSVGIAAAVPAVAISAATPNDVRAKTQVRVAKTAGIDPAAPIGPVKMTTTPSTTTPNDIEHRRLAKRFLKLKKRLNRLVAERDGRKARKVRAPVQLRWSNRAIVRANRKLGKRIRHVRADLRDKRAGLSSGVRAHLQSIAACESGGNPRAISPGGTYRGKYQFSRETWRNLGGTGDPAAAPEWLQDRMALKLYRLRGTAPWPSCA